MDSTEALGISNLLEHDDPRERTLALKSRHVTPEHIAAALQDEDPDVRVAALHHPAITPELLRQVISGHDEWLQSEALKKPNLGEEELMLALQHPHLHKQLSEHPALTEKVRQELLQHPFAHPNIKDSLTPKLEKNQGFILYPGLGESRVHNYAMTVPAGKWKQYRMMGDRMGARKDKVQDFERGVNTYNYNPLGPLKAKQRIMRVLARTAVEKKLPRAKTVLGNLPSNVGTKKPRATSILEKVPPKTINAMIGHETQHGIFARLKQKYGSPIGQAIIDKTIGSLDNSEKEHLDKLFGNYKYAYHPKSQNEEKITYLQNYLMDPVHRVKAHINMGIANDPQKMRESHDKAKRAWKKMVAYAETVKPEHFGTTLKKDGWFIQEWAEKLIKEDRDQDLGSYLGEDKLVDKYVKALVLLGKKIDRDMYRRHLKDCGDPHEALERLIPLTSEQKRVLASAIKLQDVNEKEPVKKLHKSETPIPEEIEAAHEEGAKFAETAKEAFAAGRVDPVELGGKHSKGSMMVRGEGGDTYLLKPGSGDVSPALGVGEEGASQSRREAAFYALSQAMGINVVPETHLLNIDGREVAMLKMLPLDWGGLHKFYKQNPNLPRTALYKYLKSGELFKWAVMDYVGGQPDRHGGNLLVSPEEEGLKIGLIDHGSTFAGPSFHPSADKNSFIPYYLRVWANKFHKLTFEEKLNSIPTIQGARDEELGQWVQRLDEHKIQKVLVHYGINPQPTLERLRKVKEEVAKGPSRSQAINMLWLK